MKKIDSLEADMVSLQQNNEPFTDSMKAALHREVMSLLDHQRTLIKKDEIWEIYQNNGGTQLNAWTADDMTAI